MSNKDLWLSGLTMGLTGKGVPELTEKCLYNGVALPDINSVWTDKGMYKQCIIGCNENGDEYSAFVSSDLWYSDSNNWINNYNKTPALGKPYAIWRCHASDTEWTYVSGATSSPADLTIAFRCHKYIWSSSDVLTKSDSSVYLAASDPVPVWDDTFAKGYLLGAELRGGLRSRGTSVIYANGTLYIKNSPAIQHGSILEVK